MNQDRPSLPPEARRFLWLAVLALLLPASALAQARSPQTMFLRGNFNNWGPTNPMALVGANAWQATITLPANFNAQYKFEVSGQQVWSTNWGDNAPANGVADPNGANIAFTTQAAGDYVFNFNDSTLRYAVTPPQAQPPPVAATDPGVRGGAPGAGGPLPMLDAGRTAFFNNSFENFQEAEAVVDGLGPRHNLDSCVGCHSFPAPGGTSPAHNPQVDLATRDHQTIPWFIVPNGPAREVRFKTNPDGTPDGGVHAIFTITGRTDTPAGCNLAQPNFGAPGNGLTGQGGNSNIIFRIATPVFGTGLVESISDTAIRNNLAANGARKAQLGISGHVNTNGNDGTVTRFGWKAQNKSALMFAAEAYNVEMGISNELFTQEREENPACTVAEIPNSPLNFDSTDPVGITADIENFAIFMRFSAPPAPAPATPSTTNGRAAFDSVGCALCHTPTLQSGPSPVAALSNQSVNLFSDLAVHHMGSGLADGVSQGAAGPDEFRSAPLWGVGQRIFFLHDGRTTDLVQAIRAHSSQGSEANQVVSNFNALPRASQQDLLNFLRSL
jgi:CxxC motif-containing protein (DUF1111 family)